MPSVDDEQPIAVRASSSYRESRWLHRRIRICRYDACWADGRVEFDVDLVGLMYRGQPADFDPIDRTVHLECPEDGVGPWVDRQGQITSGPEPEIPSGLDGVGRRFPDRVKRYTPGTSPRPSTYAWRIGPGLVGLAIGVLLLTKASGASALGVLGVICVLIGLASLVSLVSGIRRS
ncbi:hypothetical protein [Microlunatus soli]|nr:hypothetical protein [Microlunatus soli]